MTIHVVQSGDTITSISDRYGVSAERIIIENELPNPDNLLVGQSIGIRVPATTHTVVAGDTVASVAQANNISNIQLLQRNPQVAVTQTLIPGQTLVITYANEKVIDTIVTNGYAYPFIERDILRKTLPYLTYLSIFTYGFTPEGDLIPIEDTELISIAQEFGVAPIMMLAPMNAQGAFDTSIAHNMFTNPQGQAKLIENIVSNIQAKGYRGLDIDFEFILPADRQGFINFITAVHAKLSPLGYITMVALAPKTSGTQAGLLYEAHDYPAIGAIADKVLLMTYEWGFT